MDVSTSSITALAPAPQASSSAVKSVVADIIRVAENRASLAAAAAAAAPAPVAAAPRPTLVSVVVAAASQGWCARCCLRAAGVGGGGASSVPRLFEVSYRVVARALDDALPLLPGAAAAGPAPFRFADLAGPAVEGGEDGEGETESAAAAAAGASSPPPLYIVCPCCSGVLQGLALSHCIPPSQHGGSCSVLHNTVSPASTLLYREDAVAAAAVAEAIGLIQRAAVHDTARREVPTWSKNRRNEFKGNGAGAGSSGVGGGGGGGAPAPLIPLGGPIEILPGVFAISALSTHAPTTSWPDELAELVCKGGYDLREGLSVSFGTAPRLVDAEKAARHTLAAKFEGGRLPYPMAELKDCARIMCATALERIVYDAAVETGTAAEEESAAGTAASSSSSSSSSSSPPVILTVTQARRTLAIALREARAAAAAAGQSSSAAAGAAAAMGRADGVTHVRALAGHLDDTGDARRIVASVSEAVAMDYRLPPAPPVLLPSTITVPVAPRELCIGPATVAAFGSENIVFVDGRIIRAAANAAASAAAKAAASGAKRKREGAATTGGGDDGAAEDSEVDSEDEGSSSSSSSLDPANDADVDGPHVRLAIPAPAASIALGTVESVAQDYRLLFDTGCVAAPTAGQLAALEVRRLGPAATIATGSAASTSPPLSVAGAQADFSASSSPSTLRRLCLSHTSSLQLHVILDSAPRGFFVAAPAASPAGVALRASGAPLTPPSSFTPGTLLLTASIARGSYFFAGRYCKYNRSLSQTPWYIEGRRRGDEDGEGGPATQTSVEECLGAPIAAAIAAAGAARLAGLPVGLLRHPLKSGLPPPALAADLLPLPPSYAPLHGRNTPLFPRYKFHSAGREDVDVRMLGPGRPYMIELLDARAALFSVRELASLHVRINEGAGRGLVESTPISTAARAAFTALAAGADSKRKTYTALVWSSAAQTEASLQSHIDARVHDLKIAQRTPIRVLHRRSLLTRSKVVHEARTDWLSPHFFLLHCVTSAGTYVKELVHGDLGRTRPSIGELLSGRGGGEGEGEKEGTEGMDVEGAGAGAAASSASTAAAAVQPTRIVSADILILDVTDLLYV